MTANHQLFFGKYKGKTLEQVPSSYLSWLAENCKLSSGLRLAVAAELRTRGVAVAEQPAPAEPTCPRCGPRTALTYSWHEDSLGRRRIKRTCRCGCSLAFAPHISPFVELANAAVSPTAVLDVLTLADELGVVLEGDGKAVRIKSGWQHATPTFRQRLDQCRNQLAKLLGEKTVGGSAR
jgi:uncharacterized protein (DUF3820 family)